MKSKKITYSAIIASLSFILLYTASILPTGKIGLFLLSSVFLSAVVIECGNLAAILCYITVSLLSFFLIPNKAISIPYLLFFGYYPLLKLFFESKIKNIAMEYAAKILCGNVAFFIIFFIMKALFVKTLGTTSFLILWIGANIVFVLFDIVFSMMIGFYNRRIHSKISF